MSGVVTMQFETAGNLANMILLELDFNGTTQLRLLENGKACC